MPNYKEQPVTGEAYQRAWRVICENKRGDTPHVTFLEEEVITLGGKTIAQDAGQVTTYFEADGSFPLLNPETGEPLGASMTHTQLRIAMFSLYMQATQLRDNPPEPDPVPEPDEPAEPDQPPQGD